MELFTALQHLAFVTFTLVPLGILLHYWRRADSTVLMPTPLNSDESSGQLALSRQLIYARLASGISVAAAIFVIFLDASRGFTGPDGELNLNQFVWPFAAAIVSICVVMLALTPMQRTPGHRVQLADLSARSLWTFGQRWWFGLWVALAAVLITTVVLAGLAASDDDQGRSAALVVELGNSTGSSTFLGWYFGVPLLIGAACLILATGLAIWANTRPALAAASAERAIDVWLRRYRTRTILVLSGGALCLVLGSSLMLIGIGGSISLSVPGGNQLGTITAGTAIAALALPFRLLGMFFEGVGLALLILPLFTQRPGMASTSRPERPINGDHRAASAVIAGPRP